MTLKRLDSIMKLDQKSKVKSQCLISGAALTQATTRRAAAARKGDGCSAGLGGVIFSRITTLFGTAVEAARSSEGIFTSSFFFWSCFHVGECPVDPMRMRFDSIMKLDQKSKVKKYHETRPKVKKSHKIPVESET